MQFNIRALLAVMVVVSVLCGVLFASSTLVALPLLCVALWITPAVWVSGIIYARRAWRPFFLGGAAAGLVPHLIACYHSLKLTASVMSDATLVNLPDAFFYLDAIAISPNLLFAILFVAPSVVSIAGGLIATWVDWAFREPVRAAALDGRTATISKAEQQLHQPARISAP